MYLFLATHAAAGALSVALFLAGLMPASGADGPPVLRRGTSADAPSLDPVVAGGTLAAPIIYDLFEGLLGKDAELKLIPGMAERWTISPDGKVYTFHLRAGLVWSDGRPFTAGDFVWSYRRLMDPATASPLAGQFYPIENGREIVAGELPPDRLGVSAPDPRTFVMRLHTPAPYFLELIGNLTVVPTPRHVIEKFGKDWTRPEHMVTNGPYILTERIPQVVTRLRKNPRYHAANTVRTTEVGWYPTQDLATTLRRFRAGELDQILNFPPDEIDRLREEMPDALKITPSLGVYFLVLNLQKPPFGDVRVRRALSLAIDREGLTEKLLRTGVTPADTFVSGEFSNYRTIRAPGAGLPLARRQAQARELLSAAGFGPGKPPLTFTYVYDTNEENRKIAVALAAMWQAVGVKAELVNVDFGQLNRQVRTHGYEVARWTYFASYDDPYALLQLFATNNTNNWPKYSNAGYDRLLEQSNHARGAERVRLLQQAERILLRDAPIIPIYDYTRRYLVSPQVRGWVSSERGPTPSRFLWVE